MTQPRPTWRFSWRRHIGFVVLLGLLVATAAVIPDNGSAATPAASLQLKGEGSWGAYREILPWQDALSQADSPIDLNYAAHGTVLGRQDFVAGEIDFVLSGTPFSAEELAKIPGGASGVISAPVQVSSMAAMMQRPIPDGFLTLKLLCDPDDPNTPDPDACIARTPLVGPVRVPNENLAAMLLQYTGGGTPPLSSWNSPGVLDAMGVENFTTPLLAGPGPVMRSDQDEFNYFLQQYVARAAPSVWSGLQAQDTRIQWEPITERLGRQASSSRDGVVQQGQQMGLTGGGSAIGGFTAGAVAPVPASAMGEVREAFPNTALEFIQVQNANGDWVAPTPESISRAVEAGGEQPLYALTNKVPGAYPLAWVDSLSVPAHGLSREKAEALATVIRYVATAGQKAAKPVGEGKLPDALVKKALNAANQVVRSNCTGKVIENTDPGPYAPDVPEMKSIGAVAHCTTDPVDASTGSFSSDGSSFSSFDSSSGGSTSGTTTDGSSSTGAPSSTAADGKQQGSVALAATKLPLPFPSSTSGIDRLATLMLGAALYLVLRRPVKKMLARSRT